MADTITDYLKSEVMGSTARYPFTINTSASRILMAGSQDGGKITVCNPSPRLTPSGIEEDFAQFTLSKKIEEDCEILGVIPLQSNRKSWLVTLVFKSLDTGEIGMLTIPEYHSMHNKFGFMYKHSPDLASINVGSVLTAGTILADSPSVVDGDYSPGINLEVAVCSLSGTAEDAILFNRDSLYKTEYDGIRSITFKVYPDETCRPIYPNGNVIPEPGDKVRDDNILAAVMKIDERIFLAQLSDANFGVIDYNMDNLPQIDGSAPAEVISVEVLRSNHIKPIPQLDNIAAIYDTYYNQILTLYKGLRRRYYAEGKELVVTPELTNLIQRAEVITVHSKQPKNKTKLTLKQEELPPYLVTIVTRQRMVLANGGKLSDESSAKGVVHIVDPERLPLTAEGVRADVAMSKEASPNRMIMGRDLQLVMGQAVQQAGKMVRVAMKIDMGVSKRKVLKQITLLVNGESPEINEAYRIIYEYMLLTNRDVAESFQEAVAMKDIDNLIPLLALYVEHGVIVPLPVDYMAKNPAYKILKAIKDSPYSPPKSRVTYVDHRGILVSPKKPIRVGPISFNVLEKTGAEISVSSTAKVQALGFYAVNSKQDKDMVPVAKTNVKVMSTDEAPVLCGALGQGFTAELVDRMSSPNTHQIEVKNILMSDHPTAHDTLVPRGDERYGGVANRIKALRMAETATPIKLKPYKATGLQPVPYGMTTARRLFTNILACYGTCIKYTPEK